MKKIFDSEVNDIKNVITIQHTQSVHHKNGMVGSWTDWELTDLGKKQAENIGRKLSVELTGQAYKIYSSDLIRAKQTAEPLARYMDIKIIYRKELREHNLGKAVGKTGQWAKDNSLPVETFDDKQFIGAESWREFWNRVSTFCCEIVADEAQNIILVSHGVTLSVWQSVWLGLDIHEFKYSGMPSGVSFMRITEDDEHIIQQLNDSFYIEK